MRNPEIPFPDAASPACREFLADAEAYLASIHPPLSQASLSSLLFGSGVQIKNMIAGSDVTTARLTLARERLEALRRGGPRRRPAPPST